MADDFDSITSSQISFLKICPFAEPESRGPTKSSDRGVVETESYSTEILMNSVSPPAVRTQVLSISSPTSLDSINDEDVFRTPPENASLSSAADSEPIVRVSQDSVRTIRLSPSIEVDPEINIRGEDVPFKEIMQALVRNSGDNVDERDEQVSFLLNILKQRGLKFP